MGNHDHFVLHIRRTKLSRMMRHLYGVYKQAYNRWHLKVGHLFQGRFKAILVDRDAYLLEVCREVELNPAARLRMVSAALAPSKPWQMAVRERPVLLPAHLETWSVSTWTVLSQGFCYEHHAFR